MVNQLRQRRQRLGLTQQSLADLAGASRSMVRMLEAGYEPRRGSAVAGRLAAALSELEGSDGGHDGQRRRSVVPRQPRIPSADRVALDSDLPPQTRTLHDEGRA